MHCRYQSRGGFYLDARYQPFIISLQYTRYSPLRRIFLFLFTPSGRAGLEPPGNPSENQPEAVEPVATSWRRVSSGGLSADQDLAVCSNWWDSRPSIHPSPSYSLILDLSARLKSLESVLRCMKWFATDRTYDAPGAAR